MGIIYADKIKEDFSEVLTHNYLDDYAKGFKTALIAVLGYETITLPPNNPLTLEELREMDEEPVWVVETTTGICYWAIINDVNDCGMGFYTTTNPKDYGSFALYDKTWIAYRRRPKEGKT